MNFANKKKYDLVVQIHFNAGGGTGTETLYKTSTGKKYAEQVTKSLGKLYKQRGAKVRTDLYWLNKTSAPAILVEVCFVDSTTDTNIYNANKPHTDVNVGNKVAEERIKDINEAYRVLSNPSSKRKYDRTWNYNIGSKQKKTKQKTSGEVVGEFFGMFFGNDEIKEELAQSKIPAVKGENIETEINITIEDGFYGVEKKIALKDLEGKDKTITVKVPEGIQNGEKTVIWD